MRSGIDPCPCSVGWWSGIAMSCGVGCRRGSDLALLWLWCRLAATALIRPLAWEPPICHGRGPRNGKKKKDKKKRKLGLTPGHGTFPGAKLLSYKQKGLWSGKQGYQVSENELNIIIRKLKSKHHSHITSHVWGWWLYTKNRQQILVGVCRKRSHVPGM